MNNGSGPINRFQPDLDKIADLSDDESVSGASQTKQIEEPKPKDAVGKALDEFAFEQQRFHERLARLEAKQFDNEINKIRVRCERIETDYSMFAE